MRRFLFASLVSIFVGTAQAQPELRLSTAVGPAYPLGRAGERWAQLLSERANGAFVVRNFPGAVLALRDPLREFGALRDGETDLAVGSALAWSAQLPALAVFGLPWIAPETPQQEALASDVAVRDRVAAIATAANVVVIAIAPLGERVISTSKAPVLTPADMRGLRLRATPVPIVVETLATLNARVEAMPMAAAQAAFAAGTLDGQEATASTLAATRVAASGQKFVTRLGGFSDVMVFAARKPVWDVWNEEQRAIARAAAIEAARDAAAQSREDAALADLTKQGVTLVRPTAAQRAEFRAAAEVVWAKWRNAIGADLVDAAVAAAKR